MKKIISVFLAIVMVFSAVAFAAPTVVKTADSAGETGGAGELSDNAGTGELMGTVYKTQRGINTLTGTKDALTGENFTIYGTGLFSKSNASETIEAVANPDDSSDTVIRYTIPGGSGSDYHNLGITFNGSVNSLGLTPYFFVSYDVKKSVPDTNGYTSGNSAWIMNTNANGQNIAMDITGLTPEAGWIHISEVINLTWYKQDSSTTTYTTDPTGMLVLHTYVENDNTVPVHFYLDNIVVTPCYKVTYYDKTGSTVVYTDYIAADSSDNLLTSFMPSSLVVGRGTYGDWATSVGGTPLTAAIPLSASNNSDIVLYATSELDAFDGAAITLDEKLSKLGSTATATVNLVGNPHVEALLSAWSSSNTDVATVVMDKDDPTKAVVKAVSEGKTTLTFKYEYASGSYATVTQEVEVSTTGKTTLTGLNTDVYEYITVNVTNSTSSASSVTLNYTTTEGSGSKTITVPASVSGYDVYADLSDDENWKGTTTAVSVSPANGVTVNNTKAWAKLATDLALKFNTASNFIGTANTSLTVSAVVDCDLEGVYDKTYTWTTDVTNSCATLTNNTDGSVTVSAGEYAEGFVTLTAKSNDTSDNVSITKKIYVKTGAADGAKAIAYKWDFSAASQFSFGGHHNTSVIENGYAKVVKNTAKLSGATSLAAVSATLSGSSYTLASSGAGSMSESGKNTTEFKMTDYPYYCFVARTDYPGTYSLKAYLTTEGQAHAENRSVTKEFDITDEWQTFVFDLAAEKPLILTNDANGNYGGTMFVNNTESLIDTSAITTSNTVSSPLTYSTYKPVYIDEIYFANYNPADNLEVGVYLEADKYSLTGDGTFTLTTSVYANEAITNTAVNYTTNNSSIVNVFKNDDGTATVTPIGNGTVTITATSVLDNNASDSVTLTISGVQTKIAAYDLKLFSLGNSYLRHGYAEWFNKDAYNGWINETDELRGMAASKPELDYFNRIQYYISQNFDCSISGHRIANSVVEKSWQKGLANANDTSDHTNFDYVKARASIIESLTEQLEYIKTEKPNIITIQLAENAGFASKGEMASFFYDTLYDAIDKARPEQSVVVVITPCNSSAAASAEISKATEYGFYVANCTDMTDKKWQAWDQYPDFSNPNATADFRGHPGDLGMDEIAKRVFAQLENAIPANITPEYVYVPDSIAIAGGNAITTDAGTLQLTVAPTPAENSTTKAFWSVDNKNVATIDENGLLTAVNNGEVNVTAVCAYDESIKATLKVTVSGQLQAFTVTYAAGTMDSVTGLPEADNYAKGTYTLSTTAPDRNGYKFLGWSLTSGGETVKTVEMTKDITVYAIWEFATAWEFDNEGDKEGISLGGFHDYVRYEENAGKVVATVTTYGGDVSIFDNTLLVNSDDYTELVIKAQFTASDAAAKFGLTVTSTDGTFNYALPITGVAMKEYVFDISNVTGTITGFSFVPSIYDLAGDYSVYVDYIRFLSNIVVDTDTTVASLAVTEDKTINAANNTYTVSGAVTVADGATLTLKSGTFVFASAAGNIVTEPGANLVITGEAPENYVAIDLSAQAELGDVSYEIDGKQFALNHDIFGMTYDEDKLIQIVVKANASLMAETNSDVSTYYYAVDAETGTATEITAMGNYMQNGDTLDMRNPDEKTNNTIGVRFKAQVSTDAKYNTTDYTITEIGYLIGLEETIVNNGDTVDTFNFNVSYAKASGVAYNKSQMLDKVFDQSIDGYHVFTGVLYGCTKENYGKNLVAKTYTKVTLDGSNYIVYGEPMVANFYEIAKSLEGNNSLSDAAKAIIAEIIDECENGKDTGFDVGGL